MPLNRLRLFSKRGLFLNGSMLFSVLLLSGIAIFISFRDYNGAGKPAWIGLIFFAIAIANIIWYYSFKRQSYLLRESIRWQQAILANANHTIIATQPDGIIQFFNPAAERLLGYSAEELVGIQTPALFHKSEEVQIRAIELSNELGIKVDPGFDTFVAKARRMKVPDENQWTYIHRDGSTFPVRLSVTALWDDHGKLLGYLGIGNDLSEEVRKTNELLQSFEEILAYKRALDQEYIVAKTDKKGKIVFVNERFCAVSGYEKSELIGRDHRIVNSGHHSKEFFKGMWKSIESGETWRGLIRNRKKSGDLYWVDTSITPIYDENGEIKEYLAARHDVTDEVVQKEELLRVAERALEASKAKSEFLANMSHEIRTPMNGVIGITDLLLKTNLDEKQARLASTIKVSGETLMAIVNDILDFSKIEAGKIPLENLPFSVRDLVESKMQLYHVLAVKKNLIIDSSIDANVPEFLVGDVGRIGQILSNIMGNAVKFTDRGRIALRVAYRDGLNGASPMMKLAVEDSGIGMSGDEIGRLFQPFQQADGSTSRKYGGTGLGLSICKRLAELMGGSIRVESEKGKGSTFFVELPLARTLLKVGSTLSNNLMAERVKKTSGSTEVQHQMNRFILVFEESGKESNRLMAESGPDKNSGVVWHFATGESQVIGALNLIDFDGILVFAHKRDVNMANSLRKIKTHMASAGKSSPIYVALDDDISKEAFVEIEAEANQCFLINQLPGHVKDILNDRIGQSSNDLKRRSQSKSVAS